MDETAIRYHPLIAADSEGMEMVPLFVTTNEDSVVENHSLYLSEVIPGYLRLCSRNPVSQRESDRLQIHCPQCGKILKQIARNSNKTKLGLYTCNGCK